MQKRELGTTGIQVPIICLGTMTWGRQNTEEEAHEQLDYAIKERGLDFIDTAEMYPVPPQRELQGLTETYIGSWLKKNGNRDSLTIASKIGANDGLIQTRPAGNPSRYVKKQIREAIQGSLSRLQTDHLDLYQVHWPERNTNFFGTRGYSSAEADDSTEIAETLEALQELVQEGLVKHIGISNETPWGVHKYIQAAQEKDLPRIQSIQNQYSLTNRTYEIGLSEMTIKENISMLAYSVLNMGVLTGKYLDGKQPEGARFTDFERNSDRYNPERAQATIQAYVDLAKKHNMEPATLAIAFATSRPFITSVIIGATSMDQLKVCIDAGEVTLSEEVLAEIETIHAQNPDVTH